MSCPYEALYLKLFGNKNLSNVLIMGKGRRFETLELVLICRAPLPLGALV